jgi:cation transport ATPase
MNRKTQDSTDELLRALRASMDEDANASSEEEMSPDDVFSDRASGRGRDQVDEEIAAFDSYMAALLGDVVGEDKASAAKSAKAKKSKKKARAVKVENLPARERATDILTDVDAPEGPVEAEQEVAPVATEGMNVPVVDDIPEPDEDMPHPDTQVGLPGEVLGEVQPQIDGVFVTDEEIPRLQSGQETIEQLRIPTDSFVLPMPETTGEKQAPELPSEDMSVTASGGEGSTFPEGSEDGYLPVEGIVSEAAQDIAEQQKNEADQNAIASLQAGDLLLDADDETPQSAAVEQQPSEDLSPAKEKMPVEKTTVPVASPLDAVRQSNARAEQMANEKPRQKQSPLDAIAAGRAGTQGNVTSLGGGAAFGRPTKRERTLTDDDMELLLDLGYENSLSQKVGAQRVESLKHRRQGESRDDRRLTDAYGCSGEEYTGHDQDDAIRATYRKQTRIATVRQVFSLLMVLFIALTDFFPLLCEFIPYDLSFIPNTGMYGALSMVLLLIAALICLPYLKRGCASLLHLSPLPAAIPVLMLVVTWLYDVLGLFDPVCNFLFNVPSAIALFLLATGERMRVKNEAATFAVVSTRARKVLLADMDPKKKKVVRDGHIVKIINDDADRPWRRVRQAEQLEGYFRRMSEPSARYRNLAPLMAAAIFASIAVAIAVLLLRDDLRLAAGTLLFSILLTLPSSALIAYAHPMLLTTKELSERGCAIVGDSAVDEYAEPCILLFDDTEMFRSKSSTEITIKGGGDTKKYIRYAKRLFRTLGGTLRHVTTSDLSEELYEDRVEILRVMDEGVEACIDGKAHVLAGTAAFMTKNGIRVPSESAELLVRRHVESCILYLAFEGKLRLGYEIDYRISGRFEQMVAELAKNGTSVAVESCDPDIHAEFLSRSRGPEMPPVRVVKPVRFERAVDFSGIDSGVVSTRTARDIARATDACRRLAGHDRFVAGLQWLMLVVGCAVAVALMLLDVTMETFLLTPVVLPLVWCIPCMLSARKTMKYEQDQESENDNRN